MSTTTVESCIAVLARFDRGTARRVCLEGIRDSLEASYSGQNTPCIAAAACEVFGEIENLDQVFDDFLIHCQELFRHLPSECWFDWLKQYVPRNRDENEQIADILIDQLAEPEIELGRRLMAGVCELCCERASAAQLVASQVLQAEGLQQGRLLQVLHATAYRRPERVRQRRRHSPPCLSERTRESSCLCAICCGQLFRGWRLRRKSLQPWRKLTEITHRSFPIKCSELSTLMRLRSSKSFSTERPCLISVASLWGAAMCSPWMLTR